MGEGGKEMSGAGITKMVTVSELMESYKVST